MYTKITSKEHLYDVIQERDEPVEFFILLNGGIRSSKSIMLVNVMEDGVEKEKISILNEIDDSEIIIDMDEIFDNDITLVGEAMRNNRLFQYD